MCLVMLCNKNTSFYLSFAQPEQQQMRSRLLPDGMVVHLHVDNTLPGTQDKRVNHCQHVQNLARYMLTNVPGLALVAIKDLKTWSFKLPIAPSTSSILFCRELRPDISPSLTNVLDTLDAWQISRPCIAMKASILLSKCNLQSVLSTIWIKNLRRRHNLGTECWTHVVTPHWALKLPEEV